jgi:thiol:disulfide interchange protein
MKLNVKYIYTKAILLMAFCLSAITTHAQGDKRLQFRACFTQTKPNEGDVTITANIEKSYHVFSFNPGGDGSQIPTKLTFAPNKDLQWIGKTKEEGKLIKEDIKELEIVINYYKDQVKYIQHVQFKNKIKTEAEIYFQVCNDAMCERPSKIKIPIDLSLNCDGTTSAVSISKIDTTASTTGTEPNTIDTVIKNNITTAATTTTNPIDTIATPIASATNTYGMYGSPVGDCGTLQEKKLSPWLAFLYGLLGGFAALFFPCTLPMIPMTISFFLKGKDSKKQGVRNGIFYGFSIFLVYFLLSLPFLFLNIGGQSLNALSTNVWVNILFFIIFIVFAFSLFGFYDISLPGFLVNKVDAKSNTKSKVGIFFMALTLAIVSFSCTGPILGLVLGNVTSANLITPAMSGFGIGLGVPFALFAMFPNLLKAMPKSGGWLTTLKVVFAFIELAFALKFLSNADLTMQWGILKREIFMGLWIIICVIMGLYLLGLFKIKKTEVYQKTIVATIIAVFCFVFAGYLSLDFFGKDVNLVSGFPPPKFYSLFHKEQKVSQGTSARTHELKGLTIYLYLEDAIAEGKKQNKPVMIDFTGWACVNCRKMEENVWPNPEVYQTLKDNYIIASLYVDEQITLPKTEQFYSPYLKTNAVTVGDKWFDLSLRHFNNAGQPFYALIDPTANKILNTPKPYMPDAAKYNEFLKCGLVNYKQLHP